MIMMIDGKIRITMKDQEWKAFPKDKREKMKLILQEQYGIDIHQILDLENEGDSDGRDQA
jgi:hypothetical protein